MTKMKSLKHQREIKKEQRRHCIEKGFVLLCFNIGATFTEKREIWIHNETMFLFFIVTNASYNNSIDYKVTVYIQPSLSTCPCHPLFIQTHFFTLMHFLLTYLHMIKQAACGWCFLHWLPQPNNILCCFILWWSLCCSA